MADPAAQSLCARRAPAEPRAPHAWARAALGATCVAHLCLLGRPASASGPRPGQLFPAPAAHAAAAAAVPPLPPLSPFSDQHQVSQTAEGVGDVWRRPSGLRAATPNPGFPRIPTIQFTLPPALAGVSPVLLAVVGIGILVAAAVLATSRRTRRAVRGAWRALVAPVRRAELKRDSEAAAKAILKEEVSESLESAEPQTEDVRQLSDAIFKTISGAGEAEALTFGDTLEKGWERRGSGSAFRRNLEVWRYAARCAFKVLAANRAKRQGKSSAVVSEMQTKAAEFIRDGLLRLGPTFVKLGQVVSTRTDLFSKEYIDVLKTLQDDVPPFSGSKAKAIVAQELGRPVEELFEAFSDEPIKAASLGQVHRAMVNGKPVAVKVQRAGLKELFDVDLKNLKKLAELLDKFDPKTDGADRCWADIYDESAKLLYLEIDYLNEARNADQFAECFSGNSDIRVPKIYYELTTPRVLTMEFVESFKLTDIRAVEDAGLDKKAMAKKTADAFLFQILKTGYFHCDPHPGNLCANAQGQLVYYDFGMMAQLKPNVQQGFRDFCFALFEGGPFIDDIDLGRNAKRLTAAVERMGVLARGADRLSVDKLARFFIRTFKDIQIGKKAGKIKEILGDDLQALTKAQVFRFPSTFTFIFRAFASIDGIGKGLDPSYDLTKLAQPYIEELIFAETEGDSPLVTGMTRLGKATGLNADDLNTALTSPRRIAYIESIIRDMEQGSLRIRVRALENEKSLERLSLQQGMQNQLLVSSVLLNVGLIAFLVELPLMALGAYGGAAYCGLKAAVAALKVKTYDKRQAQFEQKSFNVA